MLFVCHVDSWSLKANLHSNISNLKNISNVAFIYICKDKYFNILLISNDTYLKMLIYSFVTYNDIFSVSNHFNLLLSSIIFDMHLSFDLAAKYVGSTAQHIYTYTFQLTIATLDNFWCISDQ